MSDYQIIINEGVDENTKEIIEKYWLFENNEFKYSLKHFQENYALNQNTLVKLIKAHSYCLKKVSCDDCSDIFDLKIETKGYFKDSGYGNFCPKCQEIRNLKKLEQDKERKRLQDEYLLNELKKREEKMSHAVERQLWLTLNISELSTLKEFVRLKDMVLIKKYLYNKLTYKQIAYYENKFQELGFIFFPSYKKNFIEFAPNLEVEILNYNPVNEIPSNWGISEKLGFSLAKKIIKTTPTQGDYAGTFELAEDVILKANQKYVYGGWIQTDGSINLRFTPAKDLNSPIQTNFDDSFPWFE